MRKKIYVSLEGYLSDCGKTAVCHTSAGTFSIVEEKTEKTVFTGNLTEPMFDEESGDEIRIADFSGFKGNGRFFLKCGYRRSETFEISNNICKKIKNKCLRGIYLNRCGFDFNDKTLDVCEDFLHGKCHCEMTPLYFGGQQLDVSGGWHDGGYGKYVNVSALTCASMLYSYLLYPESFDAENGGEAPILSECRWGLEWLLKMQAEDGGVYHKSDTVSIPTAPVPPCEDMEEYYVFPISYDATLYFTAAVTLGARVFENIDVAFAKRLSHASSNGWLWIVNCSDYEPWKLPSGTRFCGLGDFDCQSEKSIYLWMISELYALTGSELFAEKFEELVYNEDSTSFTLENAGGYAALAYMTCGEKKNPGVDFFIKKKFGDKADKIIFASSKGYGTALGSKKTSSGYNFFSNMSVISDSIICQIAFMIFGIDRYRSHSADILGYIMGRNPIGISYITGGETSPLRPAHSLSVSSSEAVPGMIVSGANFERIDEFSKWRLASKTPPAKCYIDNECSYTTNCPSICFGALAVMAAAFYDSNGLTNNNFDFKC